MNLEAGSLQPVSLGQAPSRHSASLPFQTRAAFLVLHWALLIIVFHLQGHSTRPLILCLLRWCHHFPSSCDKLNFASVCKHRGARPDGPRQFLHLTIFNLITPGGLFIFLP